MKSLNWPAFVFLSFALVLVLPLAAIAQTAVPMLINYQGELRSLTTGDPVPDGPHSMVFIIFGQASGGVPLWTGTHTNVNGNPVQVTNAIFSVILGSGPGNVMDASVFDGAERWLEIRAGRETFLPRQLIASVPYSLISQNSRLLGGYRVSDLVIQDQGLRLQPNGISPNIIAGYVGNGVTAAAVGATIAGGGSASYVNSVTDNYGTIGGGGGNQAGDSSGTTGDASYATVGGGGSNSASAVGATVGGGVSNTASGGAATVAGGWYNQANASYATIAGGGPSDPAHPDTTRNLVTDDYGTIGGGGHNQAGNNAGTTDDATYATVAGGWCNTASANRAVVAGGEGNQATGTGATVGGGEWNKAFAGCATVGGGNVNKASGTQATVGGGFGNTASGFAATVPGGLSSEAIGDYSFAAGTYAYANGAGSFVWGDHNWNEIHAWGDNQFVARATGGFWFVTAIDANGVPTEGMMLPTGSSHWVPIGSTAAQLSTEQSDRVQELESENTSLKQRIDDLESRLEALIHSQGGVQR